MRGGALLLGLLLVGCPPEPPPPAPTPADLTAVCCPQCRAAASQDPQAMDLTLVPCASYAGRVVNGARALDDRCADWFRSQPATVGECPSSP